MRPHPRGWTKKHVLTSLDQPENRALHHRVEKDSRNFGRVFVHFRWTEQRPYGDALSRGIAPPHPVVVQQLLIDGVTDMATTLRERAVRRATSAC